MTVFEEQRCSEDLQFVHKCVRKSLKDLKTMFLKERLKGFAYFSLYRAEYH